MNMDSDSHLGEYLPRTLLIGLSSSLDYLTWALAEAKWQVTVVSLNAKFLNNKGQQWSFYIERQKYEYMPQVVMDNMLQFTEYVEALPNIQFDIVFVTCKSYTEFKSYNRVMEIVIHPQTVFLIDSNQDVWIAAKIGELYPDNIVLSIYSDADCRCISVSSRVFRMMNDLTTITVGTTSEAIESMPTVLSQGVECDNQVLTKLRNVFKDSNLKGKLVVLQRDGHTRLSKTIWKNILRVICFEGLSIIFEEPDILSLAKQLNVAPLMKGVFHEILNLCKYLNVGGLPLPYTESSKKLLQSSILLESNLRIKRIITCTNIEGLLPKYIESTKLFYDFTQGLEINITGLLLKLLKVSDEYSIKTPFLESTYSFINRLITIRDGIDNNGNICPSKLFQVRKNEGDSTKTCDINGIPPNKNMMNFPPFNPPPPPKPPTHNFFNSNTLVFMSEIRSRNTSNNNSSHVKKNTAQVETLTTNLGGISTCTKLPYYEKYYDTVPLLDPDPQIALGSNHQLSQNIYPKSQQDLSLLTTSNLPLRNQPGMTNGQDYTHQSQGYALPNQPFYSQSNPKPMLQQFNSSSSSFATLANTQSNYPSTNESSEYFNRDGSFDIPKKRQTFFHASIPITRKTSSQKLRQSHASLLDMIHFNDLMDKTTSSRYGVELDTSSNALNSANNSRGSKTSSSRTSSKMQSPQIPPTINGHVNTTHNNNTASYTSKPRK